MDFEKYVIDTLAEIKRDAKLTLTQTTLTNGRVTSLEKTRETELKRVDDLVAKSNRTIGRDSVLLMIALASGTVIGYFIVNYLSKHF